MFKGDALRSRFPRKRRILLILCLVILGVAVQGTTHGPVAHASGDPMAIVAVDATPATCEYIITAPAAQGQAIQTRCAPGTVIRTVAIPLSQAQAQHEAYVMLLPAHATYQQLSHWMSQIHQLILEKRKALQHPFVHGASCRDRGTTVWVDGGFQTVNNDYVNPEVQYHVNTDCSTIFLDTVQVVVGYVPYNNPVYWNDFEYSYFRATCSIDYLLYPNQTYWYHPDVTESIGLDGVFYFQYPGDACRFGGGILQTIDVGPLT